MQNKLPKFKMIIVLLSATAVVLIFQNCSPFSSQSHDSGSLYAPQTDVLESPYTPFPIDFSVANSKEKLIDFKDQSSVYTRGYYDNQRIIVTVGTGTILLYNILDQTYEFVAERQDSTIGSIFQFTEFQKIFYTESDGLNSKKYLQVYNVATKQTQRLIEIKTNDSCAAYPSEKRIPKIVCNVAHSTNPYDSRMVLIDANALTITYMAEVSDSILPTPYSYSHLENIRYQYRRGTFVYPLADAIVIGGLEPSSNTEKRYKFTKTAVVELTMTDKDDFWGDGRQLTFTEAINELAINPNKYAKVNMCLGLDFTGPELTASQHATCTLSGMYMNSISNGSYSQKVCRSLSDCDVIPLIDQNLKWDRSVYWYMAPNLKTVVVVGQRVSNNSREQRHFSYELETKKATAILQTVLTENRHLIVDTMQNKFIVSSPQFYETANGPDRAQVVFDRTTRQVTLLARQPVSLSLLHTSSLIIDGALSWAIQWMPSDPSSTIYATANTTSYIKQEGFKNLSEFHNRNTAPTQAFLQKTEISGKFDIYKWNLATNTTTKLFTVDADTAVGGVRGLFSNQKIIYLAKNALTGGCTIELRDPVTTNIIFSSTSSLAGFPCSFGAIDTPTGFVFVTAGAQGVSIINRYDYTTKKIETVGTTKYSGNISFLKINKLYHAIGNALLDSDGKFIMTYDGYLYNTQIGTGSYIYGLKQTRSPQGMFKYMIQKVNPITQEIIEFEESPTRVFFPNDSGLYYQVEKTSTGVKIINDGKEFLLNGSSFSQAKEKILYVRKTNSGAWQYVYTDITAQKMNESIMATKPRLHDLEHDIDFYRRVYQ